jgi:hypothetical protein
MITTNGQPSTERVVQATLNSHFAQQPGAPAPKIPGTPLPKPDNKVFYGLAGQVVRLIEPETESDPIALTAQLLLCFGNIVGRTPHWKVDGAVHYLNLFVVLTGATSKSRKGTSWRRVLSFFAGIDDDCDIWAKNCIHSGLSTGQGMIQVVRDPDPERNDPGYTYRSALFVEEEFARLLRQMDLKGSSLSTNFRQAWDGVTLADLNATSDRNRKSTHAHISLLGHITEEELKKELSDTDKANGFANRTLHVIVCRSKELSRGGNDIDDKLKPLQQRFAQAIDFAKNVGEMGFDEPAGQRWDREYSKLSNPPPGLAGALVARGEPQVRRLACIYALLDQSATVQLPHLEAALAFWDYAAASISYIFGNALGNKVADEVLQYLTLQGPQGASRTQLFNVFKSTVRNKDALDEIIALLHQRDLILSRTELRNKRDVTVYQAKAQPDPGNFLDNVKCES